MANTYKIEVSAEEGYLLEQIKKCKAKFESERACQFYESGFIDGFYTYKEFVKEHGNENGES